MKLLEFWCLKYENSINITTIENTTLMDGQAVHMNSILVNLAVSQLS